MAPPAKRRKTSNVEEISFDDNARQEYLTGFHKRKLQRTKHAQDVAAKKEREEKLTQRKQMRQRRKEDLEKHVQAVNAMLRNTEVDTDGEDAGGEVKEDNAPEEWTGFEEPADISREDEYIDEDRYTTVTVEAVDVSKDGLLLAAGEEVEGGDVKEGEDAEDRHIAGAAGAAVVPKKRVWTKEKPSKDPTKRRKTKFRYESKTDRKATRVNQKLMNRAAAKARRAT